MDTFAADASTSADGHDGVNLWKSVVLGEHAGSRDQEHENGEHRREKKVTQNIVERISVGIALPRASASVVPCESGLVGG